MSTPPDRDRDQSAGSASFGVVPEDRRRALSGLELLRGIRDGALPPPPICEIMAYHLVEVDEGRVVFRGTPDGRHYNPIGSIHGGFAATLLDSCMGCAVHTTLPAGTAYTTLEFKINLLRGMTDATGPVDAVGTVTRAGRRVAVADGRLVDSAGALLVTGSTTCLVFPL